MRKFPFFPRTKSRWPHSLLNSGIVLVVAVLSIGVLADNDAQAHRKKLDDLTTSLQTLKKKLATATARQSKLEKTIAKTETQIGRVARERRSLEKQQQSLEQALQALAVKSDQLQKAIEKQHQTVSEHLVKVYKSGNPNPVQLLLENGNPADIDRQLVYLERINAARHQLLNDYSLLLAEQKAAIEETRRKQSELQENRAELAKREAALKELQDKRKQTLASINAAIGDDEQQLSKLEQDRQSLQALLEEMSRVMEDAPPLPTAFDNSLQGIDFASARGALPWPVRGTLKKHSDSRWQGVTIAASEGDTVQAIFPGRVIFADWFTGQGLLLILDHGEGYWTLYGHNQSLLKKEGDVVTAGESIATVGNSGGQSAAALYFEIRHNGKASNPRQWCKG